MASKELRMVVFDAEMSQVMPQFFQVHRQFLSIFKKVGKKTKNLKIAGKKITKKFKHTVCTVKFLLIARSIIIFPNNLTDNARDYNMTGWEKRK